MLRSLTDHLFIHLHPERVIARRRSGLMRQRIDAEAIIAIESHHPPHWSAATNALKTALEQPGLSAACATIVLSGWLTRLRMAPWHWQLRENERISLVRHEFVKVYGKSCRDSQITIGDGGMGKPGLACAVEPALMNAIAEVCDSCKIKKVSIKPYLTVIYNHWRKRLDPDGAWLILTEAGMLTIVFIQSGIWRTVRTLPCDGDSSMTLEIALSREALLLGIEACAFTVYCFCEAEAETTLLLPAPFRMEILVLPVVSRWRTCDNASLAALAAT